jgi:hypothetical protein
MIIYRTYFIYCNGTILATVTTGLFQTVVNGHKVIKYYMLIKFAGLKTYNEIVDKGSYIGLMKVCAFLNGTKQDRRDRYRNNRGLPFKIKELDCCIDVNCNFENVWAICAKRAGKTTYYTTSDTQIYHNTTYIEKIAPNKLSQAVQRAYVYDKQYKESLLQTITRFEVKLQSNYFINHSFEINSIKKALDRYYFMYFDDLNIKNQKIIAYSQIEMMEQIEKTKPKSKQKKIIRTREIKKLQLEPYRLYFDIDYIDDFIKTIYSTTLDNVDLLLEEMMD